MRNAVVTPSGIPDLRKAMNSGTDEQEQKGVTAPSADAARWASAPGQRSIIARIRSPSSAERNRPMTKTTTTNRVRIFVVSSMKK